MPQKAPKTASKAGFGAFFCAEAGESTQKLTSILTFYSKVNLYINF
jgi:hypothetical protein